MKYQVRYFIKVNEEEMASIYAGDLVEKDICREMDEATVEVDEVNYNKLLDLQKEGKIEIAEAMRILENEEKLRDWLSDFDISHFEMAPKPENPLITTTNLLLEPEMIFIEETENGTILDAGERVLFKGDINKIPDSVWTFFVIALPDGSYINQLFNTAEEAIQYAIEELGYEKDAIIQD